MPSAAERWVFDASPLIVLARAGRLAPGCVDLRVQAARVLEVVIPGLVSCMGDPDCPMGQTCQANLTCG